MLKPIYFLNFSLNCTIELRTKVFSEIDIKELVRVHEEVEEEEEDSDDGADAFDSDVEEGDSEEYDTDDFSDEFTDEDD